MGEFCHLDGLRPPTGRPWQRRTRLAVSAAFLFALLLGPSRADAQTLTSTLTVPADGAVGVGPLQLIQWTSVPNAQAYVLWVGTSQGSGNIIATNELQQMSYRPALALPPNQTLYARMWTEVGGVWRSVDSSFTTAATATLVSPVNGSTDVDLTLPVRWTPVPNAQAYVLWVGTTPGANDVVWTNELQQTFYQPTVIPPANRMLYARIWTEVQGTWRSVDSSFTTSPVARLTNPTSGATNVPLPLTFSWTNVAGAEAYVLWIGRSPGSNNYYATNEVHQTSGLTFPWLPPNQTLYARMWTRFGGIWRFVDSSFTTAATSSVIWPADGTTGFDPMQVLSWTVVPNAQAYVLWIGTSPGAKNVVETNELQLTFYAPRTPLPVNQLLYARMWTAVGGVWRWVDSSFSTGTLLATLTTPANGVTNVSPVQSMQWTGVPNADAYVLWLGTSYGANNIVATSELQQTSYQPAVDLPTNQTLYARLWTRVAGIWRPTNSSFTTGTMVAKVTAPADGATNVDMTLPIRWSLVPNATAYVLWLGTTAGGHDLVSTFEMGHPSSSWGAGVVPANRTLYARMWTKFAGVWRYADSTYTAAPIVTRLTYPVDGALNVDDSLPATWTTTVPVAQAYCLWIGTAPGTSDLLAGSVTTQTSSSISGLPPNRTLYARMWTQAGGEWHYVDSTFSVSSIAPEFVSPQDGAIALDVTQPFEWTVARHAQGYKLVIGTSPGASDVLDTGELAALRYVAGALPPGPLFARVYAKVNDQWTRHSDIGFTLDTTVAPASIVVPQDGATNFAAEQGFEWRSVELARGYRLRIGTVVGGNNLHDSGEIHVVRRLVSGLPVGVPLFGRVETKIGGQWQGSDFTFSVVANTISTGGRIQIARWATDFVRRMAFDEDDRPAGWTRLSSAVWPRYSAIGSDFSTELLAVLNEVNLGLPTRSRDVAFNTNGIDVHRLIEIQHPDTGSWMLFDPEFDLTVKRQNGSQATAEDVFAATFGWNWNAIAYDFLGTAADFYVRRYYLDYPLLFLNVAQPLVFGQGHSPLAHLENVWGPVSGSPQYYLASCFGLVPSVVTVVDGANKVVSCDGIFGLSPVFTASSVAPPPSYALYRLRRFVF